jgi:hypothetical protein
MTDDTVKTIDSPDDGSYPSMNVDTLEQARAANNTWDFQGKELQMFVARGEASIATDIINPITSEKTGAKMIHHFGWVAPDAFVIRENSFKTNLSRVGRRVEQKISTSHLATVNAAFYREIVARGEILQFVNGEAVSKPVGKDDMVQFAKLYPEAASEAVESWLDAPFIERLGQTDDLTYLFRAPDAIEVLWGLGRSKDDLHAAAIFVFNSPSAEVRASYDSSVQSVETKRTGDVSSTDIEENFKKKLQYGATHLIDVKGLAIGEEGVKFEGHLKEKMMTLFNPIWFGDIVDVMHSNFDFMKGSSRTN